MIRMEFEEIQDRIRRKEYEISLHAEKERYAEGITIHDLQEAVSNGLILEDYPDDPRGPSCLVLGYSRERPIHIVCAYAREKWLRIITVYLPRPPKWIDEKTRRKGAGNDS